MLLAVTISLEVFATCCMKLAATNHLWQIGVGVGYVACFSIFPFVLQRIPLGVAYAIWSGMGTSATAAQPLLMSLGKAAPGAGYGT